jgi:5-hydroxyisourate hydrolase
MSLSTHVLDTATGRPAAGIAVTLERRDPTGWHEVAKARTDEDGRVGDLLPAGDLTRATYRLVFETVARAPFFPEVVVTFTVQAPAEHHHVPLLLSPFGYSTYRGS